MFQINRMYRRRRNPGRSEGMPPTGPGRTDIRGQVIRVTGAHLEGDRLRYKVEYVAGPRGHFYEHVLLRKAEWESVDSQEAERISRTVAVLPPTARGQDAPTADDVDPPAVGAHFYRVDRSNPHVIGQIVRIVRVRERLSRNLGWRCDTAYVGGPLPQTPLKGYDRAYSICPRYFRPATDYEVSSAEDRRETRAPAETSLSASAWRPPAVAPPPAPPPLSENARATLDRLNVADTLETLVERFDAQERTLKDLAGEMRALKDLVRDTWADTKDAVAFGRENNRLLRPYGDVSNGQNSGTNGRA